MSDTVALSPTSADTPAGMTRQLPYLFCKKHRVLLVHEHDRYRLYVTEKMPVFTYTEVQRFLAGDTFDMQVVEAGQLDRQISQHYQDSLGESSTAIDHIQSDLESHSIADYVPEPDDLLNDADEAPVIRLINAIIAEAIRDNASDIHI